MLIVKNSIKTAYLWPNKQRRLGEWRHGLAVSHLGAVVDVLPE